MSQALDLINLTLDDITPKVVDTILTSNIALQALQNRVVRITGKNKNISFWRNNTFEIFYIV